VSQQSVGVDSGGSDTGDSLKIRPDSVELSFNSVGGTRRKPSSSHHRLSQPLEEQVDASAVNNLVDSNGSSDRVATLLYSSSHGVLGSGSSASLDGSQSSETPSNYDSRPEYQQIAAKGTGSSSYQLIEIGGGSSGSDISEPTAQILSPSVSQSTNAENGKVSGYKSGANLKVTSDVINKQVPLNFGERISKLGSALIHAISNSEQDQNEIHKKKEEIITVTSPPTPQSYSPLRPIIVAEEYPKGDDKDTTGTIRPTVISPTTTPAIIHISHPPETSSKISFSGSGSAQSGSVTNKHEATGQYLTPTNELSHSQDVSLENSSGTQSTSQIIGSVTNNGLSGQILRQIYSAPKPIVVSHAKDITASFSSSGSEGTPSGSTGFVDGGHAAHAESLVYTTPAPEFVSYSQDTSGARGVTSQAVTEGHIASYTQQTSSPNFVFYSPSSSYLHTSGSTVSGKNNGRVIGVYSTPAPLLLLQSQKSLTYTLPRTEENSQQKSITTVNDGNAGQSAEKQTSIPTSVYLSHPSKLTSFSASNSGGSSQSSGTIVTSTNANSGHITDSGVHLTTPRPTAVSYSNFDGSSSGGFIIRPATVLLNSNSQPGATSLTSSAEVLAPIRAAVSLGTVHHQQPITVSDVSPAVTPDTPQVKEELNDTPRSKVIVEVQKSVSLDFNGLALKPDGEQKHHADAPKPTSPTLYTQDAVESGRQVEQSTGQQHIYTGNFIEYGQPVFRLQVHPQIGYSLPHLTGSTESVVYGYSPQIFEAQKITHFKHSSQNQLHGGLQQQAPYEQSLETGKQEQQQEHTQKQVNGQLQPTLNYEPHQVTETETIGEKYQYNQQLTVGSESNLQTHHQPEATKEQHVVTAYNQQLSGGGYNQQTVETENQVQKFEAPVQISHDVQTEYQPSIVINHQFPYQVLTQQVGYESPVEVNQQIEFLPAIKPNLQVQQTLNTASVLSDPNQHPNVSPEHNLQTAQTNVQTSEISSQSTNQGQPAYNRNPGQVVKQLQSEYNNQLLEEEKQEQVRFINQIGKALKQILSENNEAGVGTRVPVNALKEEKLVPVSVAALPAAAVVPLENPQPLVEVERPLSIEQTKLETVEKPVPKHHTKVVEKPIPVPHAVPVEITKLVAVDRPVPYPQPYAVPHPVPVPYAVPHPIGVPVPHLVPYPHVVTVPYKEIYPVYIRNDKAQKHESALYHYHVQNFPSNTPLPTILKALQYNGGRYGVPVSIKPHHFHSSRIPQSVYLTPPPLKSSGRGRGLQDSKYHLDHLRTLCVEYGFKPPLVPSVQIHEVPPSAYGPPKKD
jgi:hypothetical protein